MRVENTGGQVLIPARDVATSEHEFFAAARVLTSEGNLIEIAHLLGEAAEINPGTEATLFQGFSQELGKYELCISFENTEVYGKDWQEVCGG